MKIVFMGTSNFAVPILESLIKNYEVSAVVSQPDKPKGRGKKVLFTPVKETAVKNNITVYQPEKIKDENFIKELFKINADLFVVVAYGQKLPETILNMPKYGCINVHGSLLPKYRGAAPIQWAIINGEKVTGITIMYMAESLDTGDIILKKEVEILPAETYGSVHDKMSAVGAETIIEAIKMIEQGNVKREKQDDKLSSYAHKIEKENCLINWNKNSKDIVNLIRGLNPNPCAYTFYNNEMFKIYNAQEIQYSRNAENGEIIDIDKKIGFIVKTADSAVIIKEIQAKGGKRMNCSDYLRGHEIKRGIILK